MNTRSDVLTALSEACELEHGIACSYLYAAFTIKDNPATDDLTWQQAQLTRKWKGRIYFIAAQEMLHLAQVWNILIALGGTPYYGRPNFPQSSKYYPIGAELKLERFGENALKRFIFYERPMNAAPERYFARELGFDEPPNFTTIGDLYAQLRDALEALDGGDLFVGLPDGQADGLLVDFPDLVPVRDLSSALAAIDNITDQGEGTKQDRVDCHFGAYHQILAELEEARKKYPGFDPARPSIENPIPRVDPDYGSVGGNPISGPAADLSEIFDGLYALMLRMLAYAFSSTATSPESARAFARVAIRLMPLALKPLGELLTMLPAHADKPDEGTAGPSFGLTRHVQLPLCARAAEIVATERLNELGAAMESFAPGSGHTAAATDIAKSILTLRDSLTPEVSWQRE